MIEDIKKLEDFLGSICKFFVILRKENYLYLGVNIKAKDYIELLFKNLFKSKFDKIKISFYYYFEQIVLRLYDIGRRKVIKSMNFNDELEVNVEIFKKIYDEISKNDRK